MPILNVQPDLVGQSGIFPSMIFILTNDTLTQVTTVGYLNGVVKTYGIPLSEADIALVTTKTSQNARATEVGWFAVTNTNGNWGLVEVTSEGGVILPTTANHIATYVNTMGGLSEDPPIAISGGAIQAGLSGTSGYLATFPPTALRGALYLVASDNAGNTIMAMGNASQAGPRTYTLPDGGQLGSRFLITNSPGAQIISTGSLALTLGNFTATAGSVTAGTTVTANASITSTTGNIIATAGNVIAGSNGSGGDFISFPSTAANGILIFSAANAGGNFNTTISNGTVGQSTVYTLSDIGAVTGSIPVADQPMRMTFDQGASSGGSASLLFPLAFCTTSSFLLANIISSANVVSILKVTPGSGEFTLVMSGDPGALLFSFICIK